jgi:hypothetical protein
MRPAHLHAVVTARQRQQLFDAVHGRWRVAVRIIMILPSAHGFSRLRSPDCTFLRAQATVTAAVRP